MGLADFKSVGGNLIAAGGSIPSPSAAKAIIRVIDLRKEVRRVAGLTAYSRFAG